MMAHQEDDATAGVGAPVDTGGEEDPSGISAERG